MTFKVQQLAVAYKKQSVIDKLNLELEEGDVLGLIAPNGRGKTTFFKSLVGLIKRKQGEMILNKTLCFSEKREAYLKEVFFIENTTMLYPDLTVLDHLEMVQEYWQSAVTIQQALNLFHIESFQKKKIKTLSLGMKQQVLLALYYMSDAKLLLLDEPLNGLDPTNQQLFVQFVQKLQEKDKMILMSSHDLTSVQTLCNRFAFLHEGKLQEYQKEEIADMYELQKIYNELFVEDGGNWDEI